MFKGSLFLMMIVMFGANAVAQQQDLGPPVSPDLAKSKMGEFLISFTDKSPDSEIALIDKRMGLKPAHPVEDYDLSKEVFDVYVPRASGIGDVYGVMVSMCFPGHQWPPATWKPILEKYHLIWIGVTIVTDSRPVEQHAGLLLDAAYNVRNLWPTDPGRIYLATNTGERPIAGMAFYYSDIFTGTIISPGLSWFLKIRDSNPKVGVWGTDNMVRPLTADRDRAKSKSRFFLALNDSADANAVRCDDVIVHQGFGSAGFKHVRMLRVTPEEMGRYTDWQSIWFEQGVQFLDEAPPVRPGATSKPGVMVSKADATKASSALDMAQNYMAMKKYDVARTRLQQIVTDYPGTAAAKQAEQLLKQIQGK
jgi:hypothetical protein